MKKRVLSVLSMILVLCFIASTFSGCVENGILSLVPTDTSADTSNIQSETEFNSDILLAPNQTEEKLEDNINIQSTDTQDINTQSPNIQNSNTQIPSVPSTNTGFIPE